MKYYWDTGFKVFFLRQLNTPKDPKDATPSFNLPPQSYAWIDPKVQKSINKFKFDLYDKFAIINLKPNFNETALIEVLGKYTQQNLPLDKNGVPYTFNSFMSAIYDYLVDEINQETSNDSAQYQV